MSRRRYHSHLLPVELDNIWSIIEQKVCVRCAETDAEGHCLLGTAVRCQLKSYFPLIADVVTNSRIAGTSLSIRHLQNVVCTRCGKLLPGGGCHGAGHSSCPIARYYPVVADAVETLNSRLAALPSDQDLLRARKTGLEYTP